MKLMHIVYTSIFGRGLSILNLIRMVFVCKGFTFYIAGTTVLSFLFLYMILNPILAIRFQLFLVPK